MRCKLEVAVGNLASNVKEYARKILPVRLYMTKIYSYKRDFILLPCSLHIKCFKMLIALGTLFIHILIIPISAEDLSEMK